MPYPLNFAKKNIEGTAKKKAAPPGEYDCVLKDIKPAPGYVDGAAFVFGYTLTNMNSGQKYEKTETVLNDPGNERFDKIMSNIEKHGVNIENVEDLLGLHEHVSIMYEVVRGRSYLNIVNREFIEMLPVGGEKE